MKRTEEQIVTQEPLELIFGGASYSVKPLVIRDSRLWRQKVANLIGDVPKYLKPDTDDPDQFKAAMNTMMMSMPDTIIDLVFEYAKDLNREEIEAIATDAEIGEAFSKIMAVAFPLSRNLVVGR